MAIDAEIHQEDCSGRKKKGTVYLYFRKCLGINGFISYSSNNPAGDVRVLQLKQL
ncbi:MAG: hypothetical protein Q7U68_01420 [Candidatus Roizmanbacteria bacterium]|nr:hypothetical protein [Candidatus Roizmanbacteria bacterium]